MREQKPPLNETQRITVTRGSLRPGEQEEAAIRYQRRDDGWYVRTPENDEYWPFAHSDARDMDVRQLINKKWCRRYAVDPDPLDDKG